MGVNSRDGHNGRGLPDTLAALVESKFGTVKKTADYGRLRGR